MLQVPISQHIEKLPAFVMVVRLGSITKAAKALAISQAALSQSVRTLEDALEIPLLVRSKAGVKVTEAGKILFQYGEQLTQDLDLLETRLRNPKGLQIGRIRVGTHEALAIHVWPEIVERFQAENPGFFLSIISGRVDDLVSQLMNGNLDLIMTVKPKPVNGLVTQQFYTDTFKFYAPANLKSPIAGQLIKRNSLDKNVLSKIPVLTDSQAHLAQDQPVTRILTELGLYSSHYFQLNSFEAAIKLAQKRLGIALLPEKIGCNVHELKAVNVAGLSNKYFSHSICYTYSENLTDHNVKLLTDHLKIRTKIF